MVPHNAWVPITIDPRSAASDPGNLKLSLARLKTLEPDLFVPWREQGLVQRRLAVRGVREQLRLGDSRAGPFAADLVSGPNHIQRWLNVFPLVAEFLVT
jgi:hypothetical protein